MLLSTLATADPSLEPGPEAGAWAPIDIAGLSADSRAVAPGFLFAALVGSRNDGSQFVADALAKGAVAILAAGGSPLVVPQGLPILRSPEPRRSLALLASRFHPQQPAVTVAVTGTSGKTSVAEFTRQIFASCSRRAASLGTIGLVRPEGATYGSLTTPDPVVLHRTLDGLARGGVTHLALEASSHGLDQFRLDGVRLTAAAFNNLGRDHLDYHPDMTAYLDAKLRLFRELLGPGQPAVVNVDGEGAAKAIEAARARGLTVLTTGAQGRTLQLVSAGRVGFRQRLEIGHGGRRYEVDLPLIGGYQASNALVAAALAIACGEAPEAAIAALAGLAGVRGRLEVTGEVDGALVVVDYAHKPEALAAALDALRPFATGRLVCVFGCGGDRDRGKRPIMGEIASRKADVVIVTDDNPRSENAGGIRAEIIAGAGRVQEIADRAEAIRTAVGQLRPGDVLLVAGKGHEIGQIVGEEVHPFSDHEETTHAIRARIDG